VIKDVDVSEDEMKSVWNLVWFMVFQQYFSVLTFV